MKNDKGQKLSLEYSWWREGSWNPWSRKKTRAKERTALCSPRGRWQTAGFAELVMKSHTDTRGCWAKLSVYLGQSELMELSFKWDSSSLSRKVETVPTCWYGWKDYTWRHLSSRNLRYRSTNCSHKNICPRPSIKHIIWEYFTWLWSFRSVVLDTTMNKNQSRRKTFLLLPLRSPLL